MAKLSKLGILFILITSFQCSDIPIVFKNKTKFNYLIRMNYKIKYQDEVISMKKEYYLYSFSETPIIPHNSTWKNYMKYSPSGKVKFELLLKDDVNKIMFSYFLDEKDMKKRNWEIIIDKKIVNEKNIDLFN